MKFSSKKILVVVLISIIFIIIFYFMGLSEYFTLQALQENNRYLKQFVQSHYLLSVLLYISTYSLLLACGLPVVIPLALIGGFLYGVFLGLFYAQISCLLGSLISFLVLRFIIVHWIRDWHNQRLEQFNNQIQKYGYSYLLMLHFLSVVPLFVINLLAAMAKVPLKTVLWVTVIGVLPFNFLCTLAGQQLSTIHSFKDIFSPTIILLLVLLALVAIAPMIIKKLRGSLGV